MYKKKNILIFSFIGMLALFAVSCEDYLDKNPLDQISSQTFWNSQADAEMALTGIYARLTASTYIYRNGSNMSIMGGDSNQSSASLGAASVGTLAAGTIEPTSGGIINEIYRDAYRGVASCNFFLDNIDRVEMPDALKNQFKGEALFLRAMFYFTLTELYGGVPLYTTPVTLEEAQVKQSTKEQVLDQVLADLDFAIANLPNTDFSTAGHAVEASALALKSRVLLRLEDWAGAAAASSKVMTDQLFSLYDDFQNLFLRYGQAANPEIIFSVRFLNPDNSNQQDIQLQWHGILNPRQELADAFECTDGLPITTSPLYDPDDWKANRDPRMLLTLKAFDDPAVQANGDTVEYAYNNNSTTGYEPSKFLDVEELPIDYSTKSEHDWILIRYAEVLLNYAEAQNEAVGPDASVYKAVNDVRTRPSVDMPPLPAGLSQAEMRDKIRQEKRVELALEGHRYGDIKRWKTAETYIPTLVDGYTGLNRVFDPSKHYLFPFPQSEIDANPNLIQNPNY